MITRTSLVVINHQCGCGYCWPPVSNGKSKLVVKNGAPLLKRYIEVGMMPILVFSGSWNERGAISGLIVGLYPGQPLPLLSALVMRRDPLVVKAKPSLKFS